MRMWVVSVCGYKYSLQDRIKNNIIMEFYGGVLNSSLNNSSLNNSSLSDVVMGDDC